MNRTCNGRYLGIPRKKDIGTNISIRNRYTYYPLYDVSKNSFIRRYRLWVKYREKCIKEGRQFVDCKTFAKVLDAISVNIKKTLLTDPEGVSFKAFNLQIKLSRHNFHKINIKRKLKKRGMFSVSSWRLIPNRILRDDIIKFYKQDKLADFGKKTFYKPTNLAIKLDIFDDF